MASSVRFLIWSFRKSRLRYSLMVPSVRHKAKAISLLSLAWQTSSTICRSRKVSSRLMGGFRGPTRGFRQAEQTRAAGMEKLPAATATVKLRGKRFFSSGAESIRYLEVSPSFVGPRPFFTGVFHGDVEPGRTPKTPIQRGDESPGVQLPEVRLQAAEPAEGRSTGEVRTRCARTGIYDRGSMTKSDGHEYNR